MKAVSLLSGGLDSVLATRLILEQNIGIEAVYFHTPFCDCDKPNSSCSSAKKAADFLKTPFHKIELIDDFLEVVRSPKHGYGKNINPCIDCRILEFKKTKVIMKQLGASFIITGEVLNERPMSQRRNIMDMIDKEAEVTGLVLRPLSAKRLKETFAERGGVVDRRKLLDIDGRSRKVQIELAKQFGIEEYLTPSGGCLLTYSGFSDKVRDLIRHNQLTLRHVRLLKMGRHFRLDNRIKLIVGKDEQENERIFTSGDKEAVYLKAKDYPGPVAMLPNGGTKELIEIAASIVAYYINKAGINEKIEISYWQNANQIRQGVFVNKIEKADFENLRITR